MWSTPSLCGRGAGRPAAPRGQPVCVACSVVSLVWETSAWPLPPSQPHGSQPQPSRSQRAHPAGRTGVKCHCSPQAQRHQWLWRGRDQRRVVGGTIQPQSWGAQTPTAHRARTAVLGSALFNNTWKCNTFSAGYYVNVMCINSVHTFVKMSISEHLTSIQQESKTRGWLKSTIIVQLRLLIVACGILVHLSWIAMQIS